MAQSAPNNNAVAVFSTAVALRLALFQLPALANFLGDRVEVATPVTSFKRRRLSGRLLDIPGTIAICDKSVPGKDNYI